jgi:DNA polymerase
MPWPALLEQAQHCQACSLGTGAKARLFGLSSWSPDKVTPWPMAAAPENTPAAPKPSPVLIVADAPQLDTNGQTLAFSAITHPLFEQFLRAASWLARGASDKDRRVKSVEPNDEIMITHLVKCVGARPSVDPQHYHTCASYLRAQILHLKPQVLLVMGRMAAQTLVHNTERQGLPHGKLCGQLLDFEGTPMVVTQPPEYLWRTGQDKGKSWHDLCLALSVVQAPRGK